MESIDTDLEIHSCKLYHVLIFLDHCSYSNFIELVFMADDPEDPLGLEMPKAICSVACPAHSVELQLFGDVVTAVASLTFASGQPQPILCN